MFFKLIDSKMVLAKAIARSFKLVSFFALLYVNYFYNFAKRFINTCLKNNNIIIIIL